MIKAPVCIRCGRINDGSMHFIDNMCIECYAKERKLLCVSPEVKVLYCRVCGAIKTGHKWIDGGDIREAIEKFIKDYFIDVIKPCSDQIRDYKLSSFHFVTEPSWRTRVKLYFEILINNLDTPITQDYNVIIRLVPSLCAVCHMFRGGDYNVLVQLRGLGADSLYNIIEEILSKNTSIAQRTIDILDRGKKGLDILFYERGVASRFIRELAKKYIVKAKYTAETVGIQSTGRMRRRLVISVRLSEKER